MPTQSSSSPRIFVSHSSKDNDFGVKLVDDLRTALSDESAVWYDKRGGLHGGDTWLREIIEQITTRNIFIVVLSPHAVASEWVDYEVDLAWEQHVRSGKRIIPVLSPNLSPYIVRDDLESLQIIDFRGRAYVDAFNELLTACRQPDPITLPPGSGGPHPVSRRTFIIAGIGLTGTMAILASGTAWAFLHKGSSNPNILQIPVSSSDGADAPLPPSTLSSSPLLYQADWSKGMDGWDSPSWTGDLVCKPDKNHKGWLFCDWNNIGEPGFGSGSSIFAPYQPAVVNYAVEAEIQVVGILSRTSCSFGILVRWSLNQFSRMGGYLAGIEGLSELKTPIFEGEISPAKAERNKAGEGYKPGKAWHRYRVEVKNNTITLFIDNSKIFVETDDVFQDAGQVGLLCSGCQLDVRNFKVIGL